MAATSATRSKPMAVTEIDRLGIGYTEVSQFDLSQVSKDRRVQVRDPNNYAPKDSVERYAIQMSHSAFPPIVMTRDNWIVDGNTRAGACELREEKFFPALVLDVAWEGATEKRRNEVVALAATLNAQNGVPLTGKETRQAVRVFIDLGWLNEQIARAIGVKASRVTMIRKEIDAEAKLHRVGLSSNGDLKGASIRALGAKDVLSLNDVPFKTLAELAGDAGLNSAEILAAARDAKGAGSDAGALDSLRDLRTELAERIKEQALTGQGRPPMSRRIRQFLGNVTKYDGRERELVETNPDNFAKHTATLELAIKVLSRTLELQRAS